VPEGRIGLLSSAEGDHADVRTVDGEVYVCPWRTRLRELASLLSLRESTAPEMVDAFVPESEAKRAQRELARIVSIQNPYNLLNRSFEVGLAEMAIRENVGLLAYSPLGFGVLTGKFLNGARPPESRVVRWSRFARYSGAIAEKTTAAYVEIARRHGLDPAQMALAFVNQQRFVASNLIGATTMPQLRTNLGSAQVRLSEEVIREIDGVHQEQPNPCP